MAEIKYVPYQCSMKECAFPLAQCSLCMCNVSVRGKAAFRFLKPNLTYMAAWYFRKSN